MERIEMGEINTAVSVTGQKEIVMLGRSFNRMIDKIRELMDRIVKEQREKRKTELRALQNQINPHFLYNSLDSIVWLAEHDRSEDVITTVIALARFFRLSISGGAIFIPVKDEVEHVKNYLTIQSIRYMKKIDFKFDIQDSIKEKIVMKLILQPIVENAIHHGLEDEGGWIKIIGRESDSSIIFEIINSGYGVSEKRLKEMNRFFQGKTDTGVGVGLRNVTQRLKLYYGDSAGIFIHCNENDETIVTVTIPIFSEKLKEV
jgi:two-component system sensor histidine kinase YesM